MDKKNKRPKIEATLGEKIKFYRLRLGLSQEELAYKAGLGVGTISEIEQNNNKPLMENIHKLSVALELSAKETAYVFGVNLYLDYKDEIGSK
jgi:transcriptional regulator with XRE-family HTH domain